jgi:hypothetical protein
MQILPPRRDVGFEVSIMLPSFRLIAATFLCGFVVVFVGLRMAVSLHDIHEGLPVMAAHAAPVSVAPAADSEARRAVAAMPVMYDLRFAVSTVAPTLVRATPTVFEHQTPALSITLPPELTEPAKEPAEPQSSVAALTPDTPASAAPEAPPNVVPDIPAAADAPAEAPKPATQAVAAVQPQVTPEIEASTAEALIPEPDTTASVDVPNQNADPAPAAEALPPAAAPAAAATPAAKPKAASKPAPKAAAKPARKKSVRTAHRAAPANTNTFANPVASPFGTP